MKFLSVMHCLRTDPVIKRVFNKDEESSGDLLILNIIQEDVLFSLYINRSLTESELIQVR